MRLIDADALVKALEVIQYNDIDDLSRTEDLIDNAPTVDAIPNAEGYEMYNKGYVQGYKRDKAEAIPKGEWEEPFESNGKTYHKCTHCHISSELTLFNNFCPNCGADMRGDAE